MLRCLRGSILLVRYTSSSSSESGDIALILRKQNAKKKPLSELLEPVGPRGLVEVVEDETGVLSGVPAEHRDQRFARIYQRSREATQSGWNNTKGWKIELDNRERWENPNIGWASSGDPLSNISMNLDFASKEDAIRFCEKNEWNFEVEEPHHRAIKPKNYGSNFAWNKRTRVSTK